MYQYTCMQLKYISVSLSLSLNALAYMHKCWCVCVLGMNLTIMVTDNREHTGHCFNFQEKTDHEEN